MKKIGTLILLLTLTISVTHAQRSKQKTEQPTKAKYIFYFIGDGMGLSQVTAAETYLSYKNGRKGGENVSFSQFPVIGLITTHSASHYITCSSAAGTALATGYKTNNGMLGVAPDKTPYKSIAYKLKDQGMKIGIMSSVGVNHATPAAFYGHNEKRSNYYDIASELPKTNFEFFAGASILNHKGKNRDQQSMYDIIEHSGYGVARGVANYQSVKNQSSKLLLVESPDTLDALRYYIDRKPNDGSLTLSFMVKSAIDFLTPNSPKGFFMMAEGGAIDWAGHGNDAATNIGEVLDLSEAVEIAYKFYTTYPNETLIIVTADHETGGMALGNNDNKDLSPEILEQQKSSATYTPKHEVKILGAGSGIGFTSGGHTATMVPVYAIGAGSHLFNGKMDNTDIPKRIMQAAGYTF